VLDKQLCKWIHKKDITVGDIILKITPYVSVAVVSALLIGTVYYALTDLQYRQSCIKALLVIGTVIIVIYLPEIISKITRIKVAHCPNVTDESEEE
jgi:hypothetical protein